MISIWTSLIWTIIGSLSIQALNEEPLKHWVGNDPGSHTPAAQSYNVTLRFPNCESCSYANHLGSQDGSFLYATCTSHGNEIECNVKSESPIWDSVAATKVCTVQWTSKQITDKIKIHSTEVRLLKDNRVALAYNGHNSAGTLLFGVRAVNITDCSLHELDSPYYAKTSNYDMGTVTSATLYKITGDNFEVAVNDSEDVAHDQTGVCYYSNTAHRYTCQRYDNGMAFKTTLRSLMDPFHPQNNVWIQPHFLATDQGLLLAIGSFVSNTNGQIYDRFIVHRIQPSGEISRSLEIGGLDFQCDPPYVASDTLKSQIKVNVAAYNASGYAKSYCFQLACYYYNTLHFTTKCVRMSLFNDQ